jgi:hypothetical protein
VLLQDIVPIWIIVARSNSAIRYLEKRSLNLGVFLLLQSPAEHELLLLSDAIRRRKIKLIKAVDGQILTTNCCPMDDLVSLLL